MSAQVAKLWLGFLFLACAACVEAFSVHTKWPITNGDLKLSWAVVNKTSPQMKNIIRQAFNIWTKNHYSITIRFFETRPQDANITLMWIAGDHGDGYPFDEQGSELTNVVAHTFYPTVGHMHFDAQDKWSMKIDSNVYFPYVLVHEIGHVLGLGHSTNPSAIMYGSYKQILLKNIQLTVDDKCAIDWLYAGPLMFCKLVQLSNLTLTNG